TVDATCSEDRMSHNTQSRSSLMAVTANVCPRGWAHFFAIAALGVLSAQVGSAATLVKDISTAPLAPLRLGIGWGPIHAGSTLFFDLETPSSGCELWRSDGMPAGTMLVKDINPGSAGSCLATTPGVEGGQNLPPGIVIGSTIFFTADDGVHGAELWKS